MFARLSVKKPYTVLVGVTLVLILGVVSFSNMTTDLLPSIDLPFMIVSTPYIGASPEKVELDVTRPLEQILATTNGLEEISSVSSENVSMIMLQFSESANMDTAMIDVNGKINQIEGGFEDTVSTPILMKMNPDMIPIMMLSVDLENMTIEEVSQYVETHVIPEFERIEGVASVEATGLIEEHIRVQLNEEKMAIINDRVLAGVDAELGEQVTALNQAQRELQNVASALTAEKDKQVGQLEQVKGELDSTILELENKISTIDISREELEQGRDSMEALYTQNQGALVDLDQQLEGLTEEDTAYSEILAEKLALEEINTGIQEEIGIMKQGLELFVQLDTLKGQQSGLGEGITTLNNQFSAVSKEFNQGQSQINMARKELENARAIAYENVALDNQLTIEMVSGILKAQNFSMPAGYIKEGDESYIIKVGEALVSLEELKQLTLFEAEGIGTVKLDDVADIAIRDNSDEVYTNINGNPGVILTFQKASAYSTSGVSKAIRQKIDEISAENEAISMISLSDQGVYIELIIDSVMNNLIYGGLLAIIILILFLRSLRTTLVVAFSIPISVLFAIVLMYFSGVTLNMISLSGLALGVGMLVDNSIVVIENIYRLRSEGVDRKEAAVQGAQQVSGAIFASTLTTIGVFFPIVFASGMTKELFVDMGLTIAYSLLASLLVAVTVVPAMSSVLLTSSKVIQKGIFYRLVEIYGRMLRRSLEYKGIVILAALGMLLWMGYTAVQMGTSFMPSMDTTQMQLTLSPKEGLTSEETYQLTDTVIERLLTIEDIETVGALESGGIGMGPPSGQGEMMFYVILNADKTRSNEEIGETIYAETDDLDIELHVATSTMDMSALSGSGIQLVVKGDDIVQLTQIGEALGTMLQGIEGAVDISDGKEETTTETRIVVDKNKAIGYGLTTIQVYQAVANAIKEQETSTSMQIANEDYSVIVAKTSTLTKEDLMTYTIEGTQNGETIDIALGDIARVEEVKSLESIRRDQQARYITVSAGIDSGYNIGLVSREVEDRLADFVVPEGYTVTLEGESESIKEAMSDLFQMMLLAVIFVYLIMVAQFQSLLSPFIVMFTIPLAFTGGILALWLTGTEISIISMLGFLVLAGIIVNNGIVFVDYVNQLRDDGLAKKEALVEAGKTRIRPILMTVLTTVLAMTTMALGLGMGAEMTQGLAIVSIGGLLYGTVLTLFVIPVLYDLFNRKKLV